MLESRPRGHALGRAASSSLEPARPAILSVATEVPSTMVTTAELAERLGVSEDWIVSRTGIRTRPVAGPDELLSEFAARAGAAALSRAGVDAADLDLVLVATLTQDALMPNAAPVVAHAIGADRAGRGRPGRRLHRVLVGAGVGSGPDRDWASGARAPDRRRLHDPDRRLGRQADRAVVRRRRRGRGARPRRRRARRDRPDHPRGRRLGRAGHPDRPFGPQAPDGRARGLPQRGGAHDRVDAWPPSAAPG